MRPRRAETPRSALHHKHVCFYIAGKIHTTEFNTEEESSVQRGQNLSLFTTRQTAKCVGAFTDWGRKYFKIISD